MSTPVLPQLQTVEAELAAQADQLEAQLTSVREQLSGLRAVMPMFETADTAAAEPIATEAVSPEPVVAAAPEATEKKATKAKKATPKKAAAGKATAKRATAKKQDGRAASWQKYTRPGVKNESIPDAVKLILETQPEKDFKIADVMEALFEEGMPKSQHLKARNRISNVLSGGVRSGDWYKGARGSYRMTAA